MNICSLPIEGINIVLEGDTTNEFPDPEPKYPPGKSALQNVIPERKELNSKILQVESSVTLHCDCNIEGNSDIPVNKLINILCN